MKNKLYSKSLALVTIFACFISSLFAQSTDQPENPRIKNFGWSLKQTADQVDSRPEIKKEKKDNTDDGVIRVETNLAVSDILVLDKDGHSIKGLKKEDFIVTEDTLPQQIETLSLGDDGNVPRSIVLIIDYSGSQFPYIETSVEAAKVLVDKLKPKDRMAIVTDDIELLTDFTPDKALLKKTLDSLKSKALSGKAGKSEQFSALYAVLNEIFDEDVRPIIIFQTDGDELSLLKGGEFAERMKNSRLPPLPVKIEERKFSFEDVLTAAEKARTTIFTVFPGFRMHGFTEAEQMERAAKDIENRRNAASLLRVNQGLPAISPGKPPPDNFLKIVAQMTLKRQLALAGLAKFTGGWADYLETPEQANDVYTRILSGINSRYVIGYYPTNEAKDGKRRIVKIEVRGHPEYIIWGRKSYFAPETKN